MTYPTPLGRSYTIQQIVTGTGVFDGTHQGLASLSIGSGGSEVRISAKLYGTTANSLTVAFTDAGAGQTVPSSVVTKVGTAISVKLKRTAGAITATADEVATRINAVANGVICAVAGGTDLVSVASAANLTGGLDPTPGPDGSSRFTWEYDTNTNGGLFYFENAEDLIVREIEAKFTIGMGGSYSVVFSKVNLNSALEVVSTESIPCFVWDSLTTARPDIAENDIRIILHPYQAISVTTSADLPGLVRIGVRREAHFPYL